MLSGWKALDTQNSNLTIDLSGGWMPIKENNSGYNLETETGHLLA